MKTTIKVENLKCSSCANSIHKSLGLLVGVFGVNIDMVSGDVTIEHTDEVTYEQLVAKLLSLGYDEEGKVKD